MLLHQVNADPGLRGTIGRRQAQSITPVLATPTALVAVPATVKVTAAIGVAAASYTAVNK
ncbi:hypothetical protein ACOACO_01365 [Nocardioides sp. CPCC 205120]|uniref:hypothetical protein n=1 Tax=Nocardioides sp. CPCC 205120 TaxID=3406462 RepID=UPI003B50343A